MITTRTAFFLAILAGVLAGGTVGRLRKVFGLDENDATVPGAFIGGIGAAFLFGVVVAFDAVVRFALVEKPSPPEGLLTFTILAVVLFALTFLLYPPSRGRTGL